MKKISILLLLVIFVFSSCSTNKGAKPVEDAVVVSQETVATVAPREEAPLSEVVVIEDPVEATVAEAPVVDEAVSEVGGADAPASVVETVKEVVSDPVATEPSVVATPVVEAVAEPVEVVEAEAEAVEAVEVEAEAVEAVESVEAEAEPVAAVEPAPIQEPEPVVEETVIYGELELFGEVASISMGETKAEIEYPENIVYESDIAAFIDSVGPAYKDYINGVTYRIFPGGKAEIYYPAISKEFRFEILRVLEKEIFNYIDKLSTSEVPVDSFREPTPETPDPAVEEAPAAVVASAPEAPASAPASAPAVTEVVPVEETQPVADTPAPVIEPVIVETVEKETPAPVVAVPVIDSNMDESMLSMLGIFIVIVVLYTAAVAIRSANKMPLSKGLSFVIAILFTALSIVVSTIVSGYSQIYLLYLILLFTFFVFRSKGAKN